MKKRRHLPNEVNVKNLPKEKVNKMKEKNEEKYCDMMSSLERENSTKHLFDIE
jgi:uncharacterized OsmC-like protein